MRYDWLTNMTTLKKNSASLLLVSEYKSIEHKNGKYLKILSK